MSKLIIVCGLPGTGKTTLARELSKRFSIPVLRKDSIKEALYEIQNLSTLEDSKHVGLHAMQLLYKLAEEQLSCGIDLIIEAPFYFEEDYKIFRRWEKKHELKIFSIVCKIDEDERMKRFAKRKRHKGHHDVERELCDNSKELVYKKLPGEHIEVVTNKSVVKLVKKLEKLIK